MKKKLVVLSAFIVVLSIGFVYSQYDNLMADDRSGKDCSSMTSKECSSKTSCESKTSELKAGSDFSSMEVVTTSISCDGSKKAMTDKLMGVSGVKEVVYGNTCSVSKNTSVTILYAAGENSEENIKASLKEIGIDSESKTDCSGKTKDAKGKSGSCQGKNTTERSL